MSLLLQPPLTGRLPFFETHADLLQEFTDHMHSPQVSTPSNVRRLREYKHVYETHESPYLARARFPKISQAPTGSGKSDPNAISISTAYKFRPRDVVKSQQESMRCSDHTQRKVDISYLHTHLPWTVERINVESVGTLSAILGTREEFEAKLSSEKISDSDKMICSQRYIRLSGTQLHHTHNLFQQKLVRALRENLPVSASVSFTDFGANSEVGRRKVMTESVERNLSQVTCFAMTFTIHAPEKEIEQIYVCVLSNNLTHSAWNAICYMKAALAVPSVRASLLEMKEHHSFSDNGSHLSCVENSTFWLNEYPKLFPGCVRIFEHHLTAKHGKSPADLCIRLFNDNVRTLEHTLSGWVDPKSQMKNLIDLRKKQNCHLKLSGSKEVNMIYVWCDPLPTPRKYKVLNFSTVDISSCRKVLKLADGKYQIQECIRYDVPRGFVISPKLIEKNRPRVVQKFAQPIPSLDAGVCSVSRQAERHSKRVAFLKKLSANSNTNLDFVANMQIPEIFDLTEMVSLPGVEIVSPIPRGVGRQPSVHEVRSRKRKNPDGTVFVEIPRKKLRHFQWSLEKKLEEVKNVARACNEIEFIPSRRQFREQNQSYLYNMITESKIFGISRKELARKLNLKWRLGRGRQFVAVE